MKILVTAFDPFGEEDINPALEAVMQLPDSIEGAEIHKLEVPTVFKKCEKVVRNMVKKINPDVILAIGQAGGRSAITMERIAINVDDAQIPDNEKNQPIDKAIKVDGENAYFTNLPIKAMVEAIKDEGIPASVSNSAGTFVCNHLMYQILYMIDKEYSNMLGGFIHVPFIPEQVIDKPSFPSMNLDDITAALEISIQTIVRCGKRDIQQIGGTIH